ncbi:MAG: hypothetical protein Q9183_002754 [Haloplaca sp. 2 TL-2023]
MSPPAAENGSSGSLAEGSDNISKKGPKINGTNGNPGMSNDAVMLLELGDGSTYQGFSFGANKSIAGELVFQTGMVGYPESITDPSYRGQILVITYPLVGNYGVPSRGSRDAVIGSLAAHFEASEIHIAGLVVASYAGENYSHHLATSSLGKWLKEQGVPAMYGVDTRALTKKIREEGSMLGKLRLQIEHFPNGNTNGMVEQINISHRSPVEEKQPYFEDIDWFDPNKKNLVADGSIQTYLSPYFLTLTAELSIDPGAMPIQPQGNGSFASPIRPHASGRLCRCRSEVQSAQMPRPSRRGSPYGTLGLRLSEISQPRLRWSVHIQRPG